MRSLLPLQRLNRLQRVPQSPLRRRPAAGYSTLTHYLAADGVLDALAAGAMTGLTSFCATAIIRDPVVVGTTEWFWATNSSPSEGGCINGGYLMGYSRDSGGTSRFLSTDQTPQAGQGLLMHVVDAATPAHRSLALSDAGEDDTGNTAISGFQAFTDLYLLSRNSQQLSDAGLHGLVISSVAPDAAQRARLRAGHAPWDVLGGANLYRCYLAREAYDDGGTAKIPDVAQDHGGPLSPVTATIRNGDIDDVVAA